MSRTIHLVYPHGPGIAAPHAIGRNLNEYLSSRHRVVLHDWDSTEVIEPVRGDVLLGHPHPLPGTTYRRSFRRPGWSRRLVLSPFNGDPRQVGFLDPLVRRADGYLAITGRYWATNIEGTLFSHWAPAMTQLDLALEPKDFPAVKHSFNPPGRRRILYIGHSGWQKNVGYLSEIALARPDWEFGWIGSGQPSDIPGVEHHGARDTSSPETRQLVASYDFFLTVGRADANPMSLLEAMSWGLIPFCTPQSGYVDEPGVINLPLDAVDSAVACLAKWQESDEAGLLEVQATNRGRLREHFTWARFGDQVERALEGPSMRAAPAPARRRVVLAAHATASPYGLFGAHGRRLAVAAARRRAHQRR